MSPLSGGAPPSPSPRGYPGESHGGTAYPSVGRGEILSYPREVVEFLTTTAGVGMRDDLGGRGGEGTAYPSSVSGSPGSGRGSRPRSRTGVGAGEDGRESFFRSFESHALHRPRGFVSFAAVSHVGGGLTHRWEVGG